jgi:CBS domain-containing protein
MHTAGDIIKDKDREMVCVAPDLTIYEALQTMVNHRIGAILVKKDNEIAGIWSERDFMRNSLSPDFDLHQAQIGRYMSTPVHAAPHTATMTELMDMFLGLYVRHMLIKRIDTPIGLLSIGDVVRANLLEKDKTIKELNTMASWHYYENWGWDRSKKNK